MPPPRLSRRKKENEEFNRVVVVVVVVLVLQLTSTSGSHRREGRFSNRKLASGCCRNSRSAATADWRPQVFLLSKPPQEDKKKRDKNSVVKISSSWARPTTKDQIHFRTLDLERRVGIKSINIVPIVAQSRPIVAPCRANYLTTNLQASSKQVIELTNTLKGRQKKGKRSSKAPYWSACQCDNYTNLSASRNNY